MSRRLHSSGNARLVDNKQADKIRSLAEMGYSREMLAKRFGVSTQVIKDVVTRARAYKEEPIA